MAIAFTVSFTISAGYDFILPYLYTGNGNGLVPDYFYRGVIQDLVFPSVDIPAILSILLVNIKEVKKMEELSGEAGKIEGAGLFASTTSSVFQDWL